MLLLLLYPTFYSGVTKIRGEGGIRVELVGHVFCFFCYATIFYLAAELKSKEALCSRPTPTAAAAAVGRLRNWDWDTNPDDDNDDDG